MTSFLIYIEGKYVRRVEMEVLNESVQYIKGIGPKRYALLNKLGIYKIEDALYYFPRDYEVWGEIEAISTLIHGSESSIVAQFKGQPNSIRARNLNILKWTAFDETGEVQCIWYNQPYRRNQYTTNKKYFIRGKVEKRYGETQISMPTIEEYDPKKHDNPKIFPIYPLTKGLTQRDMQRMMFRALDKVGNQLYDFLPATIRKQYGLAEKNFALYNIHFPKNHNSLKEAVRRLVFEEFFFVNMGLKLIKMETQEEIEGIPFAWDTDLIDDFIQGLPFKLTSAQERVMNEIFLDIQSGRAMNRLIQGDVGSGKTILAAISLYIAVISGYQGAFMVPTEILAKQHLQSFNRLFAAKDLNIECITGSMTQSDKAGLKQRLENGEIDIIIGTHALLQEDIEFSNLGLVVTDEQHRFGVRQRATILSKGENPHILVMSATPIPRTLSLILYGDLDISIVDELPPGRKPIKTYHVPSSLSERVYKFVRKQVAEGRQAYVVCPLIEESDKMDLVAATELFSSLKRGALRGLNIDLLHGKMKSSEKEEVMEKFANGATQVLVSTTVIEVGVDVSNATVMVIENAERFGLAQLHQLRGRVGRGDHQSYCILIADPVSREIRERMKIMVESEDGFIVAEKDLELRGPGDIFGVRQHGLPEFKIAKLPRDMEVLKLAQKAVEQVVAMSDDPECSDVMNYIHKKFNDTTSEIAMN